jgi:hypothetical protein
MATFIASMSFELHPDTPAEARKLLRAELAGRRWLDRINGPMMPAQTVWMQRKAPEEHTTDDVHDACSRELLAAVDAVARSGRRIALVRAFVQVSGSGTYGLVKLEKEDETLPPRQEQ